MLIVEGSPSVPNHQMTETKREIKIQAPDVAVPIEETVFTKDVDLATEENISEDVDLAPKVDSLGEVAPIENETSFNLFEQRQLQYFIGKKVEKDIILDNTEVLRAGERITPDIVTHITSRSTLMEVTSHLQKN